MDIEKAFDTLDHTFLFSVLKKVGLGKDYISWIETLLKNQESCVMNGGTTTQYFQLNRGAHQGDPISPYLFIICMEVLFLLIKQNPNINGIDIFEHNYLYSAYADDTTFFYKTRILSNNLLKLSKIFPIFQV